MSLLDTLIAPTTVDELRSKVIGFAQAAGLKVTNWLVGSFGQQFVEVVTQSSYAVTQVIPRVVRGFVSLDLATDPGDDDAYDSNNVNLSAAQGFLSALGANTFGTTREEASFATGFVTFVNSGPGSRNIAPYGLTFTWTAGSPPSPAPTYRNTADPTIYTNPDGTVTVPASTSITLPVSADEIGSRSSCPSSSLSLTTTLVGCSATNALAITGVDRESADVYRARCREAPSRVSFDGPADAYRYFAAKNLDGTPLLNAASNPSGITRAYVSQDSATGIVNAYFASASGAAISDDVTAANSNIQSNAFVVPGAITYTGLTAVEVPIHVVGSCKIKNRVGLTSAAVKAAILAALADAFAGFEIGGFDQVSGAGVIYTEDLRGIVKSAFAGVYDVAITTPGTSTTAIALGHVATLNSVAGDWSVTIT